MLREPLHPKTHAFLVDRFQELLLWCDGKPTWREIQPWAAMMGYRFSAWELRVLRRISDAFFTPAEVKRGD